MQISELLRRGEVTASAQTYCEAWVPGGEDPLEVVVTLAEIVNRYMAELFELVGHDSTDTQPNTGPKRRQSMAVRAGTMSVMNFSRAMRVLAPPELASDMKLQLSLFERINLSRSGAVTADEFQEAVQHAPAPAFLAWVMRMVLAVEDPAASHHRSQQQTARPTAVRR